jgi:hypothetical protein
LAIIASRAAWPEPTKGSNEGMAAMALRSSSVRPVAGGIWVLRMLLGANLRRLSRALSNLLWSAKVTYGWLAWFPKLNPLMKSACGMSASSTWAGMEAPKESTEKKASVLPS